MQHSDVLIIGAGLSGLIAARDCQRAGLTYTVIEAKDRIGGKTWSVPLHSGKGTLDYGAAWINKTTQKRMGRLADEFGLETVVQNTNGKVAFKDNSGKVGVFNYGELPPVSAAEAQDIAAIRDRVQAACLKVDLRNWESDKEAAKLSGQSMLDFAKETSKTPASLATVRVWIRAMLGLEPEEVSAMFFLDYCRAGGSLLEMRSDKEDGAQYLRFTQGTQQFVNHIASKLRPNFVNLSCPVIAIDQSSQNVIVKCLGGRQFIGRKLIVTIPSPLYSTIKWTPELPTGKQVIAESTLHGNYVKVLLVYAKPWWRELGFCGLSQTFDCGPVGVTRDTSDEQNQWSLTCFIGGEAGRKWCLLPYHQRVNTVRQQVAELFNSSEAHSTTEVHFQEWFKDPFAQGAPCPAFPPATALRAHREIRRPFRNVHFAGTETALEWTGYMDGAVESGERAAKEIVSSLGSAKLGATSKL